jgi:ribonuclease E
VVVDFIDMRSHKRQRDLEKVLRDAMKADRARWTVGKISPNGLLEVNRQRIKQALELRTHRECPTCRGAGIIASPEHVSRSLLRRIETAAAAGNLARVRISLHPELADGFQNLQRQELAALEREFEIRVEVIASTSLHRSEEKIEWFKREWSAAVEAAPVRASDVSDEPAAPAPSRRKRSRRGKAAVEAAPAAAETEPDEEPEEEQEQEQETVASEAAGEGGEKRKRRRRGGRKHRKDKAKAKPADEALLPELEVADLPIEPDAADVFEVTEAAEPAEPGATTGSAAPAGEAKSKRRRRRRRRRPSGDGTAQSAEPSQGDDEPFGDAGGDDATVPFSDDDQDPF